LIDDFNTDEVLTLIMKARKPNQTVIVLFASEVSFLVAVTSVGHILWAFITTCFISMIDPGTIKYSIAYPFFITSVYFTTIKYSAHFVTFFP